MDSDYFHNFTGAYNPKGNFGKPGLNLSSVNSNFNLTKLEYKQTGTDSGDFLLTLTVSNNTAHEERGAPISAQMLVSVSSANGVLTCNITLQWYNKTMCHAPETLWLSNTPTVNTSTGWVMDKLGSMVDPLDADLGVVFASFSLLKFYVSCLQTDCNPVGTTCGVRPILIFKGARRP